ncbi:MAG: diguanylate cyclase [Motiliproteus sp.]
MASILIERFRTMGLQRVAMSIFDSMPYALMILNQDMSIIDVNPAFSEITGYSEAEALGVSPAQLLAVDDSVWAPGSPIWDSIEQSNFWQGEIQHRHKSGGIYDELLTVTVIRDDSGEVVHHIAVSSDISARKTVERLVSYQANHDRLTGLPNRNLGYDRLTQMLAQAQRKQQQVGLMVLDLDHFKNVNDSLGHDKGDELLVKVSEGLRSLLRDSDTLDRLHSSNDDLSPIQYEQLAN